MSNAVHARTLLFDRLMANDEATVHCIDSLFSGRKFILRQGGEKCGSRTWTTAADVQGETVDMHFTLSRRLVPFLDFTWYHRWDIDVYGSGYSEVVGEGWGLQRGK